MECSETSTVVIIAGNTTAIILKNNGDLNALPMPKLKDIKISYDDPRVLIISTPGLLERKRNESIKTTSTPMEDDTIQQERESKALSSFSRKVMNFLSKGEHLYLFSLVRTKFIGSEFIYGMLQATYFYGIL